MSSFGKALRFVKGTMDTAQFVPAFKNYAIRDKVIQGSDGTITLSGVVDVPFNVCVDAVRFVRIIAACESEADNDVQLSLTPKGALRVKSGTFSAAVPTTPNVDDFPWTEPEGDAYDVGDDLLPALAKVRAFIGQDATRPWSLGVLIRACTMYATNNILLVSSPLDPGAWGNVPDFVLPVRAVDELLRIGLAPKKMMIADSSITFFYAKQWWVRTQRILAEWPDIAQLFAKAKGAKPRAVSDELRAAFAKLTPFLQSTSPVFLKGGNIRTSLTEDDGAVIEGLEDVRAAFTTETFRLVLDAATHIDFARYPEPVPFVGERIKGIAAAYEIRSTGPAPTQPTPEEHPLPTAGAKTVAPVKKRSAHK